MKSIEDLQLPPSTTRVTVSEFTAAWYRQKSRGRMSRK
jgi:hypothetical protein